MTRSAILLLLLGLLPGLLPAQVSEVGITGGVTYYVGDLNPRPISPRTPSRPSVLCGGTTSTRATASACRPCTATWKPGTRTPTIRCSRCGTCISVPGCSRPPGCSRSLLQVPGHRQGLQTVDPFVFGDWPTSIPNAGPVGRYLVRPATLGHRRAGNREGRHGPLQAGPDRHSGGAGLKVNAGRVDFQLEWGSGAPTRTTSMT